MLNEATTTLLYTANDGANTCLFCSIFILLSRESDGGAIFWTSISKFSG